MRLHFSKIDFDIEFNENKMINLTIENKDLFSSIIEAFTNQCAGLEGDLFIMDGAKELPFYKKVCFLANPFEANCNEKKILTELYKSLKTIALEDFYEPIMDVNSRIVNLLDDISNTSPYNLSFELEGDVVDFFKMYAIKVATTESTVLERLVDYIRAYKTVCNIELFVLLNIKQFFSKDQMIELYKFAIYEKVVILSIEGNPSYLLENEDGYIIDNDLCIINLNE